MLRRALLLLLVPLAACSQQLDPPMQRSCRGEYVDECRPYTYATITSASLTPDQITLNDPTMRAHVQVAFDRCPGSTMPTRIEISAYIGSTRDGSIVDPIDGGSTSDARVFPLTTISVTDPSANDLDVMIDNPFFANVPADTQITLQFATIIDECEGALFTTTYHTGMDASMP